MNGWIAPDGTLYLEDEYSGTSHDLADNICRSILFLVQDEPEIILTSIGWWHTSLPDPKWNKAQHETWFLCWLENQDDATVEAWVEEKTLFYPKRDQIL